MKNIKIDSSNILIVSNLDEMITHLKNTLPTHGCRIIRNEEKDEFLLAQANGAIKEAYIASNSKKYIILCANTFRTEAQNALLKVLEEPPLNIIFIIVTTSKSSILPTILSRVPHKYLKDAIELKSSSLDILKLDLKDIYTFLKENQKVSKNEAKQIVEKILVKVNEQKIKLTTKELEMFSNSIKLLDLNSRPINILTTLLLSLIQRKNRF